MSRGMRAAQLFLTATVVLLWVGRLYRADFGGVAPTVAAEELQEGIEHVRLPQGPWFPWSREFRWAPLPRNRDENPARDRRELAVLLEAAGATIGPVARAAGFELNAAACGTGHGDPGGRTQAVLYEIAADEFASRYPQYADAHDESCVDLWVEWSPEGGDVVVNIPGAFSGVRGLETVGRADLVPIASRSVHAGEDLHEVLSAYADGLDSWLAMGRPPSVTIG